jgi:RHS repeat-associated protein
VHDSCGCGCGAPESITNAEGELTTWDLDANGNVTEKRQRYQSASTHANDLVTTAQYFPLSSTQFGVMTKLTDPRGKITTISYDTKGNPVSLVHPLSITESRTYNSYGQLLSVEGPGTQRTDYTYYSSGHQNSYLKEVKRRYKVVSGVSHYLVTTRDYSNFGALTKLRAPLSSGSGSYETTYGVDAELLVTKVTTPSPFSYETTYAYNGNRAMVQTELQNREGTGSPISANPWWTSQTIYDDAGMAISLRREISQSGSTVTWSDTRHTYDKDFRLTKSEDPEGRVQTSVLDARGLTIETKEGSGSPVTVSEAAYDAVGRLTKSWQEFTTPGSTLVTVGSYREFDEFGRLSKTWDTTSASGNRSEYSYDKSSRATMVQQKNSAGTTLSKQQTGYDDLGRRTSSQHGTTSPYLTTSWSYDAASRVTKVTSEDGKETKSEYDDAGRLTKAISPSLNGTAGQQESTVTLEYDLDSNVTKTTSFEVDSLSPGSSDVTFVVESTYDELDRLLTTTTRGTNGTTGPDPVTEVTLYDSRGLVLESEDEENVKTRLEYDGLGQNTKTTYNYGGTGPSPIVTQAAYDRAGYLTSQTDDESKVTSYAYDYRGALTKTTHADGDRIELELDELGQAKIRTFKNSGGSTIYPFTKYTYDTKGLLTTKEVDWGGSPPSWKNDYGTSSTIYAYDGAYRLLSADDTDTKLAWEYDGFGNVVKERLDINLRSGGTDNWKGYKDTVYHWSSTTGDLTKVTYPVSSTVFEYSYDNLGRVKEIALDGTTDKPMARYWYEGPGARVVRRDRGVDLAATGSAINTQRKNFTYDALLRPTEIDHTREQQSSSTQLRSLDYGWGNGTTGRLYSISSYDLSKSASYDHLQHDYTYDKLGRLTADTTGGTSATLSGTNGAYEFTLSDAQFYSLRKKNGATDVSYSERTDGSHQLASWTKSGTTTTWTHDDRGNVSTDAVSGTTTTYGYDEENRLVEIDVGGSTANDYRFRYDALGRRVSERKDTTDTLFYYQGAHIVVETASNASTVNRVALFGIGIDELLYSGKPGGTAGTLSSTDHRWPLDDHQSSTVAVYDDSGNEKTTIQYTAYGETYVTGTETTWADGYTGRRRIGTAGLYDYRTRTYDARAGRFLQRDSIGVWGDPAELGNGYAYVGGEPVGRRDPWGEWLTSEHAELSKRALVHTWEGFIGEDAEQSPCFQRILRGIILGNTDQDNGTNLGDLRRHYNRLAPLVTEKGKRSEPDCEHHTRGFENRISADRAYSDYLEEEEANYSRAANSGNPDCDEALEALGRLSHAWEDYYAHVVTAEGSKSVPGNLIRSCNPGNMCSPVLGPSSWSFASAEVSEHGLLEPGPFFGQEGNLRRLEAVKYTVDQYVFRLKRLVVICCPCEPAVNY